MDKKYSARPITMWPYNLLDHCCLDFDGPLSEDQEKGLEVALTSLPEADEKILREYFQNGKTIKKVGDELGVTPTVARTRISKACRKIIHTSRVFYIRYGTENHDINKWIKDLRIKKQELEELKAEVEELQKFEEKNKRLCELAKAKHHPRITTELGGLELTVRSYNCLRRYGIETIDEIPPLFRSGQIKKIRHLGRKSYEEIYVKLIEHGYKKEDLEERHE